jgi:hypothetical protein
MELIAQIALGVIIGGLTIALFVTVIDFKIRLAKPKATPAVQLQIGKGLATRKRRFSCSGVMAARQREIRLPAKAKACDVCAKAAFRISTLHRRCLHDVL